MPELSLPLPKSKPLWKLSTGMQTLSKGLWRLVREKPLGAFGGVLVLVLLLCALFAHLIAPYPYDETNVRQRLKPPGAQFYLGTDNLGRDVFSRIIYGARISVTVGFAAVTLSLLLATTVGITSGYFGGKFDVLVQRVVDAWMAFPNLLFVLFIMAVLGPGLLNVILALGVVNAANRSRVIRTLRWQPRKPVRGGCAGGGGRAPAHHSALHPAERDGADHHHRHQRFGWRDPRRVDAEFSGVWGAPAVSLLGGNAERFGSLVYVQSPLDGDLAGSGHQPGRVRVQHAGGCAAGSPGPAAARESAHATIV